MTALFKTTIRPSQIDPYDEVTYINRGLAYAQKGEYDRAIQDYDQALQPNPETRCFYLYYLSFVCASRGDAIPRHLDDHGETVAYASRGDAYVVKGQYDRAIHDYDQSLGLAPNFALTYIGRGLAHAEQGEYDRAIQDIRDYYNRETNYAGFLRRTSAHAYCKQGVAYARKGEYDRAIQDFDQAIQLDPGVAVARGDEGPDYYLRYLSVAYAGRGRAYGDKGEYDRARGDLQKALALGFDRAAVAAMLERLPLPPQYLATLTPGTRDRHPNAAIAYVNRGMAYAKQGKVDRAIRDYDQALQLDPNSARAYYNRGVAYRRKGEFNRAIRDFDQILRLDPNDALAYFRRGRAYGDKGEYDRARGDLQKALALGFDRAAVEAVLERLP